MCLIVPVSQPTDGGLPLRSRNLECGLPCKPPQRKQPAFVCALTRTRNFRETIQDPGTDTASPREFIGRIKNRTQISVPQQGCCFLEPCPMKPGVFVRQRDYVAQTPCKKEGQGLLDFDRIRVRRDATLLGILRVKTVSIDNLRPESGDDLKVALAEPGLLKGFASRRRKLAFSRLEVPLGKAPMPTVPMMQQKVLDRAGSTPAEDNEAGGTNPCRRR